MRTRDQRWASVHRAVHVAYDGELDLDLVLAVRDDVSEPLFVRLDRVDRERGELDIHRDELVVLEREAADLGRAHGREVRRVREEDLRARARAAGLRDERGSRVCDARARCMRARGAESYRPLVLLPLVEGLDRALRRLGLEVGHDVAQAQLRVRDRLLGIAAREGGEPSQKRCAGARGRVRALVQGHVELSARLHGRHAGRRRAHRVPWIF